MQLRVGWVARLGFGCGDHNCVGTWVSEFRNSKGKPSVGGPKRKPQELAAHSNYHRLFKIKKKKKMEGRKSQNVLRCPIPHPHVACKPRGFSPGW